MSGDVKQTSSSLSFSLFSCPSLDRTRMDLVATPGLVDWPCFLAQHAFPLVAASTMYALFDVTRTIGSPGLLVIASPSWYLQQQISHRQSCSSSYLLPISFSKSAYIQHILIKAQYSPSPISFLHSHILMYRHLSTLIHDMSFLYHSLLRPLL